MARCNKCNKSGFFFKVNTQGNCKECQRILTLEEEEKHFIDKIKNRQTDFNNIERSILDMQLKKDEIYLEISEKAKQDTL